MSRLSGIFEQFRHLDQISISDINQWLNPKIDLIILENFIGNRIIYPQTLPITKKELEIDLAILREAIKRQPEILYQQNEKKFIIPESFQLRFASLESLIKALVEVLNPPDVTQIFLKKEKDTNYLVGSVLKKVPISTELIVSVSVNNQTLGLRNGMVSVLPFKDQHLLVKVENQIEDLAAGGDLGLVIDLRR